jgi:hypothetical protein
MRFGFFAGYNWEERILPMPRRNKKMPRPAGTDRPDGAAAAAFLSIR